MPAADLVRVRPDLKAAIELLESAALPSSDLSDAQMEHFFYVGNQRTLVALIGVELLGRDALLRSLVVAPEHRRSGLGCALVSQAESHARSLNTRSLFLLTTTAEGFFKKLGYVPADRATAPEAIRTSREFADLCPASSTFLVKHLS